MGIPLTLKQTALMQAVEKQIKRWRHRTLTLLISSLLSLALFSCADSAQRVRLVELPDIPTVQAARPLSGAVSEVAPPAVLLDLSELMSSYQPSVTITQPRAEQVIDEKRVEVKLKLKDFSIYKDENLSLGPHIQVILDQQPARSVYSLEEPIIFEDLSPGSHTLRAIAVYPWGESFKNEAALTQTTFHVLAATGESTPDPERPLLTYLEPQGTYSAEPVLLDFYLTNAPLHQVAQESDSDDIIDWQIRCTINGQSFVFDQWKPTYLKGLTPGQNWVQLTLIDRQGNPIKNAFNSTVHTFNYEPEHRDTLARIVRGELPLEKIGQIAIANYKPPAPTIESPVPTVEPLEPSPEPSVIPETPELDTRQPLEAPIPEIPVLETPVPEGIPTDTQIPPSEEALESTPLESTTLESTPLEELDTENVDSQENDELTRPEPAPSIEPNRSDADTSSNANTSSSSDAEISYPQPDPTESVPADTASDETPEPDDSLYSDLEPESGIFSELRERVTSFWTAGNDKNASDKEATEESDDFNDGDKAEKSATRPSVESPLFTDSAVDETRTDETRTNELEDALQDDRQGESDREQPEPSNLPEPSDLPEILSAPEPAEVLPKSSVSDPSE